MIRTPSQTVGPYYAIGCCRRDDNVLDPNGVELRGILYDGQESPIWDGMVELWEPANRLWGRSGTHPDGEFTFLVPRDAPYVYAYVFARGLLRHQLTKIHFGEADPAYPTLLAEQDGDGFRFDVHMQGPDATVFFEH